MKRWYIFISWTLTVQLFSIQYRIALENKSCYFPGIYIQWHINTWANLICIIYIICIGGQRGGGGGPSPPPFHKNWSEKATKRVNFSKFSWTQQHLKSRPPPFEILWPRLSRRQKTSLRSLITLKIESLSQVLFIFFFKFDMRCMKLNEIKIADLSNQNDFISNICGLDRKKNDIVSTVWRIHVFPSNEPDKQCKVLSKAEFAAKTRVAKDTGGTLSGPGTT